MLKKVVYNLLFAVVYPFLLPGFLVRMLRRGGYAARMGDRFALYPDEVLRKFREGGFVWIHAVSVGEVQVAGQLMREWRKVEPGVKFAFSTTSSTGWKMAEKEISERDVLMYNPLDFPNFVKSALKTVRPRAVVLTESEIWPNFIWTARRYRIPVFLINARVSDRSAPRYKAARWFFGDVLSSFARIFAQSDLDATRLIAAGAPERIVEVTGSFKFDVAHRNEAKERELREWIGSGRILLGGSTWPGEDEALLRIYSDIAKSQGGMSQVKLVIAPRHFEKADAVEANIKAAGYDCIRRSRCVEVFQSREIFNAYPPAEGCPRSGCPSRGEAQTSVYLADTTGELMGLYGIADVVFVGKSLCAHGSQNMIEPCLCGKPTAVGPYTENFRPVMSDLLAADAIRQVKDERELGEFVKSSFADDDGLGARAAAAVERRKGVVPKCVEAIRRALVCVALLLSVAGCGKGGDGDKTPAEPEESTFRPVKITTACIAAIEKPTATRVLLADVKAEMFRPFLSSFGVICVSNEEAAAESKFDIVFLAGRADSEKLSAALARTGETGVLAWRLAVKDMSAADFKTAVESFPCESAHLWMPSVEEWVFVGRRSPRKIKLDAMMDVFSREVAFEALAEAKATALSDVFASYVGNLADVSGAFASTNLSVVVRPEFFVTKDIPPLDWVTRGDVDEDIYKATLAEIRSMQVVRRLVIEGDLIAAAGKADDATEVWARAMLRNPRDPMLLDRLDKLSRNAEALLAVGNVAAAAKCYETMVVINPTDASAVLKYGMNLRRLGKKEMSDQVLKRAGELRKK
ncbi:MAG: 3-deoxy-D-manno-octulosonic acid transferase [Kiritimatiellae bacterium]|nr:3-deoxy-D-manno-octulosonic acid transferase [Kiritimatiellia bacterium]